VQVHLEPAALLVPGTEQAPTAGLDRGQGLGELSTKAHRLGQQAGLTRDLVGAAGTPVPGRITPTTLPANVIGVLPCTGTGLWSTSTKVVLPGRWYPTRSPGSRSPSRSTCSSRSGWSSPACTAVTSERTASTPRSRRGCRRRPSTRNSKDRAGRSAIMTMTVEITAAVAESPPRARPITADSTAYDATTPKASVEYAAVATSALSTS
jgi:hypothetical protein